MNKLIVEEFLIGKEVYTPEFNLCIYSKGVNNFGTNYVICGVQKKNMSYSTVYKTKDIINFINFNPNLNTDLLNELILLFPEEII